MTYPGLPAFAGPPMVHEQPPPFELREQRRDDTVVLAVHGDLDLATADQVGQRLTALAAERTPVLLDLDELAFMDSSGLRIVLQAAEDARSMSWRFALTPGSPQVRRLFESAGVADRLPIARS